MDLDYRNCTSVRGRPVDRQLLKRLHLPLAAEQLLATGEKVGWGTLLFDPPWTFFKTFVIKRGYMDGVEGLAIANMAAVYNFLKYAKARFMSPGRE